VRTWPWVGLLLLVACQDQPQSQPAADPPSASTVSTTGAGASTSSNSGGTGSTTTGTTGTSSTSSTSGTSGGASCANLSAPPLPAPVVIPLTDTHVDCVFAYSDDDGDVLLMDTTNVGPPFKFGRVFTYANGVFTDGGGDVGANDETRIIVTALPDGFAALNEGGNSGPRVITEDRSGSLVAHVDFPGFDTVVGESRLGDIYAATMVSSTRAPVILQHFDTKLTALESLNFEPGSVVGAIGVSRSGDVLVLWTSASGQTLAQWFTAALVPLTASFSAAVHLPASFEGEWRTLVMLADGSLLQRDAQAVFPDAKPEVDAPPAWISQRAGSDLFPIRGFTGYGAIPPGPNCAGTVELLGLDGTSCGCLQGAVATYPPPRLGRDGTLFIGAGDRMTCTFNVYPQLLQ